MQTVAKRRKTTSKPPETEIGLTIGPSPTDIFTSFHNEVLNRPEISIESLNRMLNLDGHAFSLYQILTSPLIARKIKIVPKNKRGNREADFVRNNLFSPQISGGMRTPIHRVLSQIARMLIDGFSPFEIVWKIEGGKVLVDKIAYRPSSSMTAKIDSKGEITHGKQRGSWSGRTVDVDIPIDRMLWFIWGSEFNSIYGRSIFNAPYYHYEKKHKLYYISHIAAQIHASGIKTMQPPTEQTTTKEKEKVMEGMNKIGFNTNIIVPFGWTFKVEDMGALPDLIPLIEHHDIEMGKALLAQFLDLGTSGNTGSFSLSDSHVDVFLEQIRKMEKIVEYVFNNFLIPQMIGFNFGNTNFPTLQYDTMDRKKEGFLKDVFVRIAGSRYTNLSPETIRALEMKVSDIMGLETDFEGVEMPPDQRSANLPDKKGGDKPTPEGRAGNGS